MKSRRPFLQRYCKKELHKVRRNHPSFLQDSRGQFGASDSSHHLSIGNIKGTRCASLRRCLLPRTPTPATASDSSALPSLCRRSAGPDEHRESSLFTPRSTASYTQHTGVEIREMRPTGPESGRIAGAINWEVSVYCEACCLARAAQALLWH